MIKVAIVNKNINNKSNNTGSDTRTGTLTQKHELIVKFPSYTQNCDASYFRLIS
jgi:hypothetical protein